VQQVVPLGNDANMHCQAAYYKGSSKEFVYVWSENDPLRAIPLDRATNLLSAQSQVVSNVSGPTGQSGAVLSVSSDASKDGTGILWASYASTGDAEHAVSPGILRAFDANDISKELWNRTLPATERAITRNSPRRRLPTDTCICRLSPTASSCTDYNSAVRCHSFTTSSFRSSSRRASHSARCVAFIGKLVCR
jgi:hypothetical protein